MPTEHSEKSKSLWKTVIGGAIICAAFAIMMPDLVKYLFSISRFLVLIALIFLGAGAMGILLTRRQREKIRAAKSDKSLQSGSEAQPSEETG